MPRLSLLNLRLATIYLALLLAIPLGLAVAAGPDESERISAAAVTGPGTWDAVTPAPAAAVAPGIGTSPAVEQSSETLAMQVYSALRGGQWMVAFGAGLLLVVRVSRGFVARNLAGWVGSRWGGYAYASTMALVLALGASLAAGEPPSWGMLTATLGAAWAAIGQHQTAKDAVA